MNKIYEGPYLEIRYNKKKSLFSQKWKISPENVEYFKFEMLEYTKLYREHKPKKTLWLQQNFELILNDNTKRWIEINVNEPCLEYGNEKCAFVVSKNILAHVQTIDVFEKIKSCIKPKHFATEQEAKRWLYDLDKLKIDYSEQKIVYEGVDELGNIIVKIPTTNVKHTFKSIFKSVKQEQFIKKNWLKLDTLSNREKEILKLICEGEKHQEIADSLFISINTLRTHWKNIKKKLEFENIEDIKTLSIFVP